MYSKEYIWNNIKKAFFWYPITYSEAHEAVIIFFILFGISIFEVHQINGISYLKRRRKNVLPIVTICGKYYDVYVTNIRRINRRIA